MGGCNSSSSIAVDEAHKPASPSLKIAVEKSPTKLDASQGGEVAKVKEKTLEDVLHDNVSPPRTKSIFQCSTEKIKIRGVVVNCDLGSIRLLVEWRKEEYL